MRVPIGPFAEWCRREIALRNGEVVITAEALGVDEAQLRRWASETPNNSDGRISLYRVDEILVHEGSTPLAELYPVDDLAAGAVA